jgi:hypothetical protein
VAVRMQQLLCSVVSCVCMCGNMLGSLPAEDMVSAGCLAICRVLLLQGSSFCSAKACTVANMWCPRSLSFKRHPSRVEHWMRHCSQNVMLNVHCCAAACRSLARCWTFTLSKLRSWLLT